MAIKKEIWLLSILSLIIVILVCILIFVPSKPAPKVTPKTVEGIQIISPKVDEEVSSPIKITGIVNSVEWGVFEGKVGSVELKYGDEIDSLGRAILLAKNDLTNLQIYFEAILTFDNPANLLELELVFHNENPSAIPEKDKTFTLPIKLK